jgi:hypothetical protein
MLLSRFLPDQTLLAPTSRFDSDTITTNPI